MYLNLNDSNWVINTIGKNDIFYFVEIQNDTNSYDYEFDVSLIDKEKPELEQLYNLILEKPEFAGGTLINS